MLLDFDLGEAGIGLHLVRPITELGLRVVMLTGETNRVVLAECVEAGAMGIISKREPFEHLIEQVERRRVRSQHPERRHAASC